MLPDLHTRLKQYTDTFNASDEYIYPQAVPNDQAYDFLCAQIPLIDLPDKQLEKVYYFRWWTFRKHWKETPLGHVLTEFLPPVDWAGPFNTINCALAHHLREGRWLRDPLGWMKEYIRFWLDGHGDAFSYSTWFPSAAEDYLNIHPDAAFAAECVDKLTAWYSRREELSMRPCGLFWSDDDRDGMEMSISGPGIRPTLNSYMYGSARAIARLARQTGQTQSAGQYDKKADRIRERMDHLLWDGDFYRTIPCGKDAPADWKDRPDVPPEHRVRELLGYIPWYFMMPSADKDEAFRFLTDSAVFDAPFGMTTAEQQHPRFMFAHKHECLWNGYVWPFATSQTLTAAANLLRARRSSTFTTADYYRMLRTYAASHRLITSEGQELPWIDEVMHPHTGEWTSRTILKNQGWTQRKGGYERGKDYNHSTFCDLILSGLLGISMQDGAPVCDPLIPDDWDHFCVTGLTSDNWTVVYDRTGETYGLGKGLQIFRR